MRHTPKLLAWVVIPVLALSFDPFDDLVEFASASLIRVPVGEDVLVEIAAVIALATLVERDIRVRRVHDAIRANRVGTRSCRYRIHRRCA